MVLTHILCAQVMAIGFRVMQNAVEWERMTRNNTTSNSTRSPVSTPTTSFQSHPLSTEVTGATNRPTVRRTPSKKTLRIILNL